MSDNTLVCPSCVNVELAKIRIADLERQLAAANERWKRLRCNVEEANTAGLDNYHNVLDWMDDIERAVTDGNEPKK